MTKQDTRVEGDGQDGHLERVGGDLGSVYESEGGNNGSDWVADALCLGKVEIGPL